MPFEGSLVRLNSRQCSELEEIARCQSLPADFVLRAKIVLLLAPGLSYQAVVAKLDTSAPTVGKWRNASSSTDSTGSKLIGPDSRPAS